MRRVRAIVLRLFLRLIPLFFWGGGAGPNFVSPRTRGMCFHRIAAGLGETLEMTHARPVLPQHRLWALHVCMCVRIMKGGARA